LATQCGNLKPLNVSAPSRFDVSANTVSGSPGTRQRLAAILAADAAGYSRLMASDERETVAALDAARAAFRAAISSHGGRVIDMAGDSVLAVFDTAAGAVSTALEVQQALERLVQGVPADRRLRFRIGVHLGDLIEKEDGSVYGNGVNIAARLEGLALPGGITVSDAVHAAVRNRVAATFEDIGEQDMKNIADPVRAFRVVGGAQGGSGGALRSLARAGSRRTPAWILGAFAVVLVGSLGVYLGRTSGGHDASGDGRRPEAAGDSPPLRAQPAPLRAEPGAVDAAVVASPFLDWAASEFERIAAAQTPGFGVEAATTKPQFRIGKDRLAFEVKAARGGYLYVMAASTNGEFFMLLPNDVERNNVIRAGETFRFPAGGSRVDVTGPVGTDRLIAVVSTRPRDFSTVGMKQVAGFGVFPKETRADVASRHVGPGSPWAGKPVCDPGAECVDEYGAAVFSSQAVN